MTDSAEPSEAQAEFLLTRLSQIEALSSPVRMRILRTASQPITVQELAERFGVPKTRLYYHVNLLVDEGLLVQVDERKVGARLERVYRTVAQTMQPGAGLIESIEDPAIAAEAMAGLIFDPAKAETASVMETMFRDGKFEGPELGRSHMRLTDEQALELGSAVSDLLKRMKDDDYHSDSEGRWWSFSFAFVPMDEDSP